MSRIVVIQTAFPGDVILSLPLYQALKDRDSSSYLAAVVRPESVCLLKNNPFVDEIISFDKYGEDRGFNGITVMSSKLKGYDTAIIVQRHLRSAMIAALARIPIRIGYNSTAARLLYTATVIYRNDVHEVQRCLDLIGVDNNSRRYRPKIYIDELTLAEAKKSLDECGISGNFVVIAPGSVWYTKRYVHFPQLIDLISESLNLPVVLLGGKRDIAHCSNIAKSCSYRPIDLSGRSDLLLSAAIISKAALVIANDSAPGHIAAAVDTPVVSIFGPTIRAFGFAPYSERSMVVELDGLYCRPCTRHGSDHCPQGHFRCMKDLSPEIVFSAAKSVLAKE